MIARGWAEFDWSALGLLAASDAGLNSGQLSSAEAGQAGTV